mmetsp:Transcript_18282/g.59153  ORF Transcript_18282/g.59153 Transcript_18282/m.59153 type:complete len:429 (-) Transcript_18282:64-1350(-)
MARKDAATTRSGPASASAASDAGPSAPEGAKKDASGKAPRNDPLWKPLLIILAVFGVGVGPWIYRYGFSILLPINTRSLGITEEGWSDIVPQKTFIFIGGPHRGGTSVLWKLLGEHEDIGSFGDAAMTGADESEGLFLQDIIPTFGIGSHGSLAFLSPDKGPNLGLGQYALHEDVEWTEKKLGLVDLEHRARLLNQWGYHWKANGAWDKSFWIEKSPTDAVVARYLEALVDLDIHTDTHRAKGVPWELPRESRGKFVFILRHPIANAFAHLMWSECRALPLSRLIDNWLAIADMVATSHKVLKYSKVVKLEDFTEGGADPDAALKEVFEFIGVPPRPEGARTTKMLANVNDKYGEKYCEKLLKPGKVGFNAFKDHYVLKARVGARVLAHGYDLDDWAGVGNCLKAAARLHGMPGAEPVAGEAPPRDEL